MKKRLRGLLALSIVACMAFAMSTGVVSATDIAENYNDESGSSNGYQVLEMNQYLFGGDMVYAVTSGGLALMTPSGDYKSIGNAKVTDANGAETDLTCVRQSLSYEIPKDAGVGYAYQVIGLGYFDGDNGTTRYIQNGSPVHYMKLNANAITYILTYDANGGTGSGEAKFNVTNTAYKISDGNARSDGSTDGFTKEGYAVTSWNTKSDGSGVEIPINSTPKEAITLMWNAGIKPVNKEDLTETELGGLDTYVYKFTLYAQWGQPPNGGTGGGGEPEPEPEEELDDSPAAGDSFPAAPLLAIMLAAAGVSAIAFKRRKA